MKTTSTPHQLFILGFILLFACKPSFEPGSEAHIRAVTGAIDDASLVNAENTPENWLSNGRTYAEEHYSPLDQITTENIDQLGLVWSYELGTRRGIEATPIVVDGIMYFSGPWSVVFAFDVRKGEMIWKWDPKVSKEYASIACCDVVNRGVALYKGKIITGVLDGRLAALDAATGALLWEVVTVDQDKNYSITGAVRIVKGQAIIGNGGAEKGVRGYVSAYDAETGKLNWRTYTVPGNPSEPFESKAMEVAAKTWSGEWWKYGGGGTAWDAIVYDPELNLLYIGTGNGSPWSRFHRSEGKGDNLYLSSIIALNPDNGELIWYYQTTPGDNWDYTATQPLVLADLTIEGTQRKVIMQAPKNGFFYVIDRITGELISADSYVYQTWTTGMDLETGRPIEAEGSDYWENSFIVEPGPAGGHNWHPMAYSPLTGMVYIPAMDNEVKFSHDRDWTFDPTRGRDAGGSLFESSEKPAANLLAWDPVRQEEIWNVQHKSNWNGGVLATAGNLLFQGNGEANLVAYNSKTGEKLWERFLGTGTMAAPITYMVDGKQYVTVLSGWGGVGGLYMGMPVGKSSTIDQIGRVFTFAIGGKDSFPAYVPLPPVRQPEFEIAASNDEIKAGGKLYNENCARCHGANVTSGTGVPDLRRASEEVHEQFSAIVFGARSDKGMPSFSGVISLDEIKLIQAFVISEAKKAAEGNASIAKKPH